MDKHKYSQKGPTSSLYTSFDSSLNHKGKAKCIRYNTNFRKKIKLSHTPMNLDHLAMAQVLTIRVIGRGTKVWSFFSNHDVDN